jgi:hypothetical protein
LTTNAATAVSGSAFVTQPVVEIRDAAGLKVANSSQQLTMTVSTGGTVVGTSTVTASSGVATFADVGISGTIASTYTLTFDTLPTSGALTAATQSIDVVAVPTLSYGSSVGTSYITTTFVSSLTSSRNVAVDRLGNVYYTSGTGLYKSTPGGSVSTLMAPGIMLTPLGIAVDGSGNVYICEGVSPYLTALF